jgi:hypothetical protein
MRPPQAAEGVEVDRSSFALDAENDRKGGEFIAA